MNKLVVSSENILPSLDEKIIYDYNFEGIVKKINLKIIANTKIFIEIKEDIKIDLTIEIQENIKCHILETKISSKIKMQTKCFLADNSYLNYTKLNSIKKNWERNVINLKGENSKIDFILKTISEQNEKYDIVVNHYANKTKSDIITNGVALNGNIDFNVTTYVQKNKKNCFLNQSNRIINLNKNNCLIRPILLIDEVDVIANHSALIGDFKLEEYFYLERLGIDKKTASKLLLEGFIKANCEYLNELEKIFSKYWG